jgi:tetratricopeptide (TPR) repeat protein
MAALNFLSQRLGVSATRLLETDEPRWTRLEADLRLASGDWQAAADAYVGILDVETQPTARAPLQRGLAEALCRMERPADALPYASEAAAVLESAGRKAEAAEARFWQASSLFQLENDDEARSILRQLLDDVRAGLAVATDFEVRLLISLAMVDGRAGEAARALTYLDEARSLVAGLDDRRRATFLSTLAMSYRATGDYEAAIATANQALSQYRAGEADRDVSRLENELALVHLALGSVERAREHARLANASLERLGDDRLRAHIVETQAQIELAGGDAERAAIVAADALALAERTGNHKAAISAGVTLAKASRQLGRTDEARKALRVAADSARANERPSQLRDVLTEWAALLAEAGDHAAAYDLTREALQIGH